MFWNTLAELKLRVCLEVPLPAAGTSASAHEAQHRCETAGRTRVALAGQQLDREPGVYRRAVLGRVVADVEDVSRGGAQPLTRDGGQRGDGLGHAELTGQDDGAQRLQRAHPVERGPDVPADVAQHADRDPPAAQLL